jgi:hypothetical protein
MDVLVVGYAGMVHPSVGLSGRRFFWLEAGRPDSSSDRRRLYHHPNMRSIRVGAGIHP